MEVPTKELAQAEKADALASCPFHLKKWASFERYLGWCKYEYALKMLVQQDDEARAILEGRVKMIDDILKLGQSVKRRIE